MAIRRPDKLLGTRSRPPSEALARAVNDAIDRVFGKNYSYEARSGTMPKKIPGSKASKTTRHVSGIWGDRAASDWKIYNPKGRQLAGKELEAFTKHWQANYGSIGVNALPGEAGENWTHLDLIRPKPSSKMATAWPYGNPGFNVAATRQYAGTGELYSTWADPATALAAAGGVVAPSTDVAATITEESPPGTLRSLFARPDLAAPTPPADVGFGARTIRPGYKGEDVMALQGMLRAMGARVAVDGVYGPATQAAVKAFQRANGLKVDGVIGSRTAPMLQAAVDDVAPLRPEQITAGNSQLGQAQFAAAYPPINAPRTAPELPAPLQASPTTPVERRALPDLQRLASPTDNNAPPGIGMADPAVVREAARMAAFNRRDLEQAPRLAGLGSALEPASTGDPRLDMVRKALRPVGPEGGVSTPNDPRGWGPIAANRMAGIGRADAPVPRMNPRRDNLVGSGWDDAVVAPEKGNPINPSRNTRPGWGNAMDAVARRETADIATRAMQNYYARAAADAPRRVSTTSIPYDVRKSRPQVGVSDMVRAAGAAEVAARRKAELDRSFGVMNYDDVKDPFGTKDPNKLQDRHPTAAVFNNASPGRSIPTPQVGLSADPFIKRAQPSPAGPQRPPSQADFPASVFGIAPKPAQVLSPAQAAIAARYSGLAAQYAAKPAPAYQATAVPGAPPMGTNLGNIGVAPQMPGVPPATAVPAMPAPVPPKFMNLPKGVPLAASLLTGVPIGLGIAAMNKIFGGGYRQSTAAQNARVSAGVQASDMIGGAYGGASYGRRQSDGSVTGTTRSGTGFTSRDGGKSISVGGRTYTANKNRRGYSLNV
jgi:peptidoglycan hydrolase-like protein with peptidoglycan-binding domain